MNLECDIIAKNERTDNMKVIVCVDDNNGMMFNNRRQSRDRILIEDIVKNVVGGNLLMVPYSETLFEDSDIEAFFLSEYILEEADPEDYCFIENKPLLPHIDRIDELIIYRWNRKYPADMYLDINPLEHSFKLVSTLEFAGSSHEKITKEVYKR